MPSPWGDDWGAFGDYTLRYLQGLPPEQQAQFTALLGKSSPAALTPGPSAAPLAAAALVPPPGVASTPGGPSQQAEAGLTPGPSARMPAPAVAGAPGGPSEHASARLDPSRAKDDLTQQALGSFQDLLGKLQGQGGPLTDDERREMARAGWTGATQAVAPLMNDWRTTPIGALTAAIGGYGAGAYAGRKDARAERKEQLANAVTMTELQQKIVEYQRKQQARARMEEVLKSNPQMAAAYAADPEGFGKLLAESMLKPQDRFVIGRNGEVLDKFTGQVVSGGGGTRPETDLGKLMAERDRLPPDDPRRALYDRKINEITTSTSGRPNVQQLLDARNALPEGHPDRVIYDRALEKELASGDTTYRRLNDDELKQAGYRPGAVVYRGTDGKDIVTQSAAETRDDPKFKQSKDLRDSFETLTKEARIVVPAYGKMEAAFKEDSKSGDVAALFAFMKMLDPNSVVRESEFATAGQAGSLPDQVQAYWNKLTGQGRLTPEQRLEILSAGRSQLAPYKQAYDEVVANYTRLATGFGLKPEDVITTLKWPEAPEPPKTAPIPPPPPGFVIVE